jgi:hypothetical protein
MEAPDTLMNPPIWLAANGWATLFLSPYYGFGCQTINSAVNGCCFK